MNSRYIGPLNYSINSYKTNICLHLNNQTKELCKTLYRNGLISSYSISKKKRLINVFCLYNYNTQAFYFIKQISKPGRKIYIGYKELKKLYCDKFNNNLLILSTNKGYLTNEEALRYKVGGEVLCLLK
jgi:small subunit ribosomal protein S8